MTIGTILGETAQKTAGLPKKLPEIGETVQEDAGLTSAVEVVGQRITGLYQK